MDPRVTTLEQRLLKRKSERSPLMQAMASAGPEDKVNACPFGCEVDELDQYGYCRHLVGFTNDGKTMEPLVQVGTEYRRNAGEALEKVQKGDVLIQITVSSRVYRDVKKAAA